MNNNEMDIKMNYFREKCYFIASHALFNILVKNSHDMRYFNIRLFSNLS